MKKIASLILMAFIGVSVWGQYLKTDGTNSMTGGLKIQRDTYLGNWLEMSTTHYGTNQYWKWWIESDGLKLSRSNDGSTWNRLLRFDDATNVAEFYLDVVRFNGKVGVGVNQPLAKLHINNGDNSYGAILAQTSESSFQLYTKSLTTQPQFVETFRLGLKYNTNENNGFISFYRGGGESGGFLGFSTNGNERVKIDAVGNVGIGDSSPTERLDIGGNIQIQGNGGGNDSELGSLKFYNKHTSSQTVLAQIQARRGIGSHHKGNLTFYVKNESELHEALRINARGHVGIGTTTPDYKLDVCGTIRAKEVKVEEFTCSNASFNGTLAANQITVTTNGHTADFVFQEDYQLRELREVENFIKTNKHLPDIPSAAAMEEQGVNLAEMNKLLLLKIEELTLYAVQKEKEIQALKEKDKRQEEKVEEVRREESDARKELEERLAKLEKLLLNE